MTNLGFKFELMRVKEDPVSKSADSLKLLIVTVEIGLAGGDTVKQFDNVPTRYLILKYYVTHKQQSRHCNQIISNPKLYGMPLMH